MLKFKFMIIESIINKKVKKYDIMLSRFIYGGKYVKKYCIKF